MRDALRVRCGSSGSGVNAERENRPPPPPHLPDPSAPQNPITAESGARGASMRTDGVVLCRGGSAGATFCPQKGEAEGLRTPPPPPPIGRSGRGMDGSDLRSAPLGSVRRRFDPGFPGRELNCELWISVFFLYPFFLGGGTEGGVTRDFSLPWPKRRLGPPPCLPPLHVRRKAGKQTHTRAPFTPLSFALSLFHPQILSSIQAGKKEAVCVCVGRGWDEGGGGGGARRESVPNPINNEPFSCTDTSPCVYGVGLGRGRSVRVTQPHTGPPHVRAPRLSKQPRRYGNVSAALGRVFFDSLSAVK